MNRKYLIPKGAKSMEINIAETTNKNGKKIFVMSYITFYGSPRKILEVQLGDIHVESKGYK